MTVLFSVHGGLCKSEPAGDPPGASWGKAGGKGKKSSNTFSLLSEHDIVRIHGEKWAPWSVRGYELRNRGKSPWRDLGRKITARTRSDKPSRGKESERRAKGAGGKKKVSGREKDLRWRRCTWHVDFILKTHLFYISNDYIRLTIFFTYRRQFLGKRIFHVWTLSLYFIYRSHIIVSKVLTFRVPQIIRLMINDKNTSTRHTSALASYFLVLLRVSVTKKLTTLWNFKTTFCLISLRITKLIDKMMNVFKEEFDRNVIRKIIF